MVAKIKKKWLGTLPNVQANQFKKVLFLEKTKKFLNLLGYNSKSRLNKSL